MKQYQLGLYEKAIPNDKNLREKLEITKKLGYDYLELSIDETEDKLGRLDWDYSQRRRLIADMSEVALPIGSFCLSGHRKYPLGSADPSLRAKSLKIAENAITLAADLGVPIIQLAGYDVYYEQSTAESINWFEENLRKITYMAAATGVILAFETMETSFMNTVSKALNYVNLLQSPYLQIYPDTGNITNAAVSEGRDVLKDLQTGRGHIAAVHLKESLPGKFREVPYSTGHVPFSLLVKEAWSQGVRRYLTEFWYTGSPNWEAEILFAKDYFSTLLVSVSKSK